MACGVASPESAILMSGARLIGRIRAFDKFTILLDTDHGDQMVFKHAIATVGPAAAGQPA
jgi:host factor-I protein